MWCVGVVGRAYWWQGFLHTAFNHVIENTSANDLSEHVPCIIYSHWLEESTGLTALNLALVSFHCFPLVGLTSWMLRAEVFFLTHARPWLKQKIMRSKTRKQILPEMCWTVHPSLFPFSSVCSRHMGVSVSDHQIFLHVHYSLNIPWFLLHSAGEFSKLIGQKVVISF